MRHFLLTTTALCILAPAHAQRTVLTGPLTLYVSPSACNPSQGYWPDTASPVTVCGNDATGMGLQTSPFATPQAAADYLMQSVDINCQPVNVQLAASHVGNPQYVYSKGWNVSGRFVGQCGSNAPMYLNSSGYYFLGKMAPISLRGDINNVTGAFIYPSPGNGSGITLVEGASLRAAGLTIDTSNSGMTDGIHAYQDAIDVSWNSALDMSYIWFGQAGQGANSSQLDLGIFFNSTVMVSGPIWVTGSAYNFAGIGQQSTLIYNNNGDVAHPLDVYILGTPTFSAGWALVDGSQMIAAQVNYHGTFHGPQYGVQRMGMIETGGKVKATFSNPRPCVYPFPGDQPPVQINGMCE